MSAFQPDRPPEKTGFRPERVCPDFAPRRRLGQRLPLRVWILLGLLASGPLGLDSAAQSPEDMNTMAEYEGAAPSYEGSMEGATPSAPPTTPTSPTPMALWQLFRPDFSPLQQELTRLVTPSGSPDSPIELGPKLRNGAEVAYRFGNLPMARELFFGHLARGGEEAQADWQSLRFSGHFRRPAWILHWGVSLGVTGDATTEYSPITGDANPAMDGGGFGDPGMAMQDLFGNEGMADPAMEEQRMSEMGMDPSAMDPSSMDPAAMAAMGANGLGRANRPAVAIKPEMTDPAIADRMKSLLGLVATTVTEGMKSRVTSGKFGVALNSVTPENENGLMTVNGETVSPGDQRMWIPHIVFIGEGSSREMTVEAAKSGIELLLHFDVNLKTSRTGEVQNLSRVRVIDCRSGKTLVSSGKMENTEVNRLLQTKRGTAEDYINEALDAVWKIIDTRLAVSAFPTLSADVARRRVSQLIADPKISPLRKLAEFRYLHHRQWLTDEELDHAFEIVAGPDGLTILHGADSKAVSLIFEMVQREMVRDE